ncbi:hypothetical protein [uncultured Paraglaciecola sp.]|uniref:hypothetical protein n=1 Tax=uncultured Paraglaciecola sp. TaxID=1765024 RepID=UPI00262C533F|nr:hypothetical protein [uncultured Paraglaciecola sp.]
MRYFFAVISTLMLLGCSSHYQNQSQLGQSFPSIQGQSLEEIQINIPEDFKGKKTLLLLGYKQNSQFDIDRWLIGLDMTNTQVDVYEIPTIQGMFPRMFNTFIDNGMRAGIPKSLWKGVITVYKDGDKIQAFTGNESPNNARVILLDEKGIILYMYDEGFAVSALNQVKRLL